MNIEEDLFDAVLDGDINYAKKLIDQGGDISEVTILEKWTYFHHIFMDIKEKAPIQSIQFLLDQGLDVNAIDSYGNTPLIYAVRQRNVDGISLLLENGADKLLEHENNRGVSALRMCFDRKPCVYNVCKILLEAGANPDKDIEDGKTVRQMLDVLADIEPSIYELFKQY